MESKKRTRGGSASSNGGSEERVRCVVDMYGVSVSFLDGANELVEVKTPGVSPQKFVDESDPTVMKGWDLFHEEHLEKVEMANPKLSNEEHSMVLKLIWQHMAHERREAYAEREEGHHSQHSSQQSPAKAKAKPKGKAARKSGGAGKAGSKRGRGVVEGLSDVERGMDPVCPIGRIRRMVKLDPEVQSISKEATVLMEKSMQLFTGYLARESWKVCCKHNRKAVKVADLLECVHNQEELFWLKDDFPNGGMR